MGFDSGSISYRRYRVVGEGPTAVHVDVLAKFEALSLGSEDLTTAEVDYGWCGGRHVLDGEFSHAHNVYNGCLFVGLRVDTNKVPASLRRAYIELEMTAMSATNPSGFASRKQKREAAETAQRKIEENLASGNFRRHAMSQVLWDLDEGVVYAAVTRSTGEQLRELFERTMNLSLSPMGATALARSYTDRLGRHRDLEELKPTSFGQSPGQQVAWSTYPWTAKVADGEHDFLGNEFALWLTWFGSDGDRMTTPLGEATVFVTDGIDLECSFGENGKDTIRSTAPLTVPETIIAIGHGKVPRRLGLSLGIVANVYQLTLIPELLSIAGLRLPEVETADSPRVLFEERISMLRDFAECVDAMFEKFLALRMSESWAGTRAKILRWIEGKPRAASSADAIPSEKVDHRHRTDDLAFTSEQLERMAERRRAFKIKAGDEYAHLTAELWKLIKAQSLRSDRTHAEATIKLSKEALEEEGNLMKSDGLLAAALDVYETSRVTITKPMARAMKDFVSGIGGDGVSSITLSTNIPGVEPVTIDAAGAKRVRANCDAVIAGKTLTRKAAPVETVSPGVAVGDRVRGTEAHVQETFDGTLATEILGDAVNKAVLSKLDVAGVRWGRDLRNAFDNHRYRPIPGIANKTWEKIGEAMSDWMIARMARPAAEPSTAAACPTCTPDAPETMPDPAEIDQPEKPSTADASAPADKITDIKSLLPDVKHNRLWADIGRAGEAWSIRGGCGVGMGSTRQEKDWVWHDAPTRSDAIEKFADLVGDFLETACETIDGVGEQHVAEIKVAIVRLLDRERVASAV